MIKLIYGLPGVGKTTSIRQSIKADIENGKKVILIAPEQQAVELERDMLKILPPSAQLSFETVNFTRLANKLFRIYGGLSYNYISDGLKALFMRRALADLAPMLKEYVTRAEGDSSLPELMLKEINEFKIHGVTPVMLENASGSLDDTHPLKAKLIDLSLIYSVYEGMIKNAYDDGSDDLEKLYEILKENDFFRGYSVYIDSFSSFTAWQYKIIKRIFAQADDCTVSIPSPSPDSNDLYLKSVNEMSNRLRSFADDAEITILSENHRAKSESLKRISEYLWDFKTSASTLTKIENDKSVEIIECIDPYAESEAVANMILKLIMDGYRRRDIAVIAENMDSYSGIIDCALEKANIPFYLSEKTELTSKPIAAFLLSAFAIKLKNWRREDVMAHLKTGLCDITVSEIDNFEIYTSVWDIKGNRFFDDFWSMNPDGYSGYLSRRGEKILIDANAVKNKLVPHLSSFFTRLDASKTVSELCSATYDFIISSEIAEKLKKHSKDAYLLGDRRDAMETSGTLKVLIKVLRDISSAFGDEEMTLEEFVSSFKTVLSNSDIGTIPTAADAVLLGSANMLRAEGIRAAILIGVTDGVFPAKICDTGIFSSSEKEILQGLGVELSANSSEKNAEELLYVYRAMTLPSDKLILTYYTNSLSGGISKRSIAIDRVASLLYGDGFSAKKYALMDVEAKLMSKELSLESYRSLPDDEYKASLRSLLLEDEKYAEKLRKTEIPISDAKCRLKKETAKKIFGDRISTTHSRLEAYMNCHFAYFATNVLDIRANEKAKFNNNHAGTFIHRIFEVFIKNTVDENGFNPKLSKDEIKSIVINEAKAYTDEIFKNDRVPSARTAHYISYLIKLAEVTAEALYDELLDSLFVPKYFEFKIGNSEKDALPSPEITLDNGTKIYLRGTVDRIDVYKKDGDVYLKVIDYKTGNIEFNVDKISEGGNIQLLLYLFAICNSRSQKVRSLFDLDEGKKLIPASATYISNKISKVSTEFKTDPSDVYSKVKNEITYRGIVLKDDEILKALSISGNKKILLQPKSQKELVHFLELENTIESLIKTVCTEMKEGNADADPKKGKYTPCKYCKLKQFCRISLKESFDNYDEMEDEE